MWLDFYWSICRPQWTLTFWVNETFLDTYEQNPMSNDLTKTKSRLSYKYQKIFDLLNKIWGRAELSHLHSISLFVWKLLVCRIFCCEETRREYRDSECWAHIKPSWRSGKCPGAVESSFFLLMFLSSFLSKIQRNIQTNWNFKFQLPRLNSLAIFKELISTLCQF